MNTPSPAGAPLPVQFRDPTIRVSGGWIAAFAVVWLGVWMAQLTPIQLLLPEQIEERLGAGAYWVDSVVAFGVISGIGGAAAILAYPLTGALSDRTTSRFGRRRPWIAAGALLFGVSLALLGRQDGLVGIGICWVLATVGFCVMTAALTATVSDQVPVDQRGYVSGWLAAPQAVGTILGLVLVLYVFTGRALGYLAVAFLLVVLTAPFLLRPDAVLPRSERPPMTLRSLIEGLWINPRTHRDFGWTLLGRVLTNLGNALGTSLLLYFLMFGLGDAEAEDDLLLLTLAYLLALVIAALTLGRLSDRLGRRRLFVVISSVLQAVSALILAFAPSVGTAFVAAALLGAGYGTFLAVDQALATQVLPDPHTRGKDLGIMNIALVVPQAIAPLLGAPLVAWLGGFGALFVLAAVVSLLGAAAVWRVRSVR